MKRRVTIGLVGDRNDSVPAHQAIPLALEEAAAALQIEAAYEWVPTERIRTASRVAAFDGLWCVPASPYRSMEGALLAIRCAREGRMPFLGTCGGFQHAVVEYARNVLGWVDAAHAESDPAAGLAVITPLACALINASGSIQLLPGTRLAAAYGSDEVTEEYMCSYGVNPDFRASLVAGPLREAARDDTGDLRGVELDGHPFYVATLFQPERAALRGKSAPLVGAFLQACAAE
ncbi:MAG TPA: CTP synthase [Steroidobacteraceae bacterium]|nr:CTP synthase [Steroidobacteraceae bacterium]